MEAFDDTRRGSWLTRLHLDGPLLLLILTLAAISLATIYSASGEDMAMVIAQAQRFGVGLIVLLAMAQCPPDWFRTLTPWLYVAGSVLLMLVLLVGDASKGAQRWLDLGVLRFQPAEIMKLAVPMMVASYLHGRRLPPGLIAVFVSTLILVVPTALIVQQPDLGTALLIASAGGFALYFAGLRWRHIGASLLLVAAAAPLVWFRLMHEYQRQRVLTLLNPTADPVGAGYHITQSKIAIGSGGWEGKGWLNGTQARLDFLPEANTDFIFAVFAEEFGFIGVLGLLTVYLLLIGRGLYIASKAPDTYTRLLVSSLSLTLFIYLFVNIGMVVGILPVVGLPLPLISYGGTAMVTLLASLGLMMSVHTHRKLLAT